MHGMRLLPLVTLTLLLWASTVPAQKTVGDLQDAGAIKLSADAFQGQLVQRVIVGPAASGGHLEMMYASNGVVQGLGNNPIAGGNTGSAIRGEWQFDGSERVCTAMWFGGTRMPMRCQYWYRLGDRYFLADSDSDRSAKVLVRTLKK